MLKIDKHLLIKIAIFSGCFFVTLFMGIFLYQSFGDKAPHDTPKKEETEFSSTENKKKSSETLIKSLPKPHTASHEQTSSKSEKKPSEAKNKKEDALVLVPALIEKRPAQLNLLITGLGVNHSLTDMAITELPPEVGLVFSPHAKMINRWITPAKEHGHLLFLELHNELEIDVMGLLAYFDGLLLTHGSPPLEDEKKLQDIAFSLSDKGKIVLENRILKDNKFASEAQRQNASFFMVDYNISPDTLIRDQQTPLDKEGIVTFPVELVPYLIKELQKSSPKVPFKSIQNLIKTENVSHARKPTK